MIWYGVKIIWCLSSQSSRNIHEAVLHISRSLKHTLLNPIRDNLHLYCQVNASQAFGHLIQTLITSNPDRAFLTEQPLNTTTSQFTGPIIQNVR